MTVTNSDPTPLTSLPLAEGLFTWPSDAPALIGTRCESCGEVTFPSHYGCPRCASEDMTTFELGRSGTVWTWTTQNFRPPPPNSGETDDTSSHQTCRCLTITKLSV